MHLLSFLSKDFLSKELKIRVVGIQLHYLGGLKVGQESVESRIFSDS
jgi:hypothetical protein